MIHLKLRQAGLSVNYKRVERPYQEARLLVRRRKRKKGLLPNASRWLPTAANEVWSMDFVFDRTADHGVEVIEVKRAISGLGVIRVMDHSTQRGGLRKMIRSDSGNEFCGKAMVI